MILSFCLPIVVPFPSHTPIALLLNLILPFFPFEPFPFKTLISSRQPVTAGGRKATLIHGVNY